VGGDNVVVNRKVGVGMFRKNQIWSGWQMVRAGYTNCSAPRGGWISAERLGPIAQPADSKPVHIRGPLGLGTGHRADDGTGTREFL